MSLSRASRVEGVGEPVEALPPRGLRRSRRARSRHTPAAPASSTFTGGNVPPTLRAAMSDDAGVREQGAFLELLDTLRSIADRYAGEEWMISGPEDVGGALAFARAPDRGRVRRPLRGRRRRRRCCGRSSRRRASRSATTPTRSTSTRRSPARRVPGHRQSRRRGLHVLHDRGGRRRRRLPRPDRRACSTTSHFDVDADGRFEIFLGGAAARPQLDGADAGGHAHHHAPLLGGALAAGRDAGARPEAHDRGARRRRAAAAADRCVGRRRASVGSPTTCARAPSTWAHRCRVTSRTFVSREPNAFPPPVPPADHALAAIDASYSMAPYVLGPDEALVMTRPVARLPVRERQPLEPAHADVRLRAPDASR